jgi:hypothetical protein
MSNDERRAQKKREKQKKKRDEARASRGSRRPPPGAPGAAPRETGVAGAERWPVAECYLSEHWHEQGARVHAAFARKHAEGDVAVAFFEVDLTAEGVVEALARGGVTSDQVLGEVARRSEASGRSMNVADPALVAKVVLTGLAHGRANGKADVTGLSAALGLLGDEDGSSAPEAVLVGAAPPVPAKKKGLLARLFGV